MGKRRNRKAKNKVFNSEFSIANSNVSPSCDEAKEVPVTASQLNQKKESSLQSSSYDKVSFVNSSEAKPDSRVSTSPKSVTKDYSGNSYTSVVTFPVNSSSIVTKDYSGNSYTSVVTFPLNSSSIERKSEEMNKSVYESEKQAGIDGTSAVRPKCTAWKSDILYQVKTPSDKFSREDDFERNCNYATSAEDCFEQKLSNEYESRSDQTNNLRRLKMKDSFISKVNQYRNCKASFLIAFRRWLPKRRDTLEKLRSLHREVHDNALKYNQSQAAFKELSYNSRMLKQDTDNQAIDFFTSLTAFVSDAVSGIASFAEACNVDSYQDKFQEIMDCDAEITKDLYAARSQCVARYHGVEEMMREFHSNTLTSTVCKISDTLEVDKHWEAMKNAYKEDNMQTLLNEVNYFFNNASRADVLEKVGGSLQRYVSDNPAALDACKSTGKALYGAYNTFSEKNKRSSLMENANSFTNSYLMLDDKQEVERLKSIISEDTHQNKLELRIESAIESLESEMEEMNDLYFQMSVSHSDESD